MTYADNYNLRNPDLLNWNLVGNALDAILTSAGNLAWTAYTPTFGCTGTGTPLYPKGGTSLSYYADWAQIGKLILLCINVTGETGGSTITSLTATLPVAAASGRGIGGGVTIYQGTGIVYSGFSSTSGGGTVLVAKRYDAADLGIGTVRGFSANLFYPCA